MPFNGNGHDYSGISWNHVRILQEIKYSFPNIQKMPDPAFSTAYNYHFDGHK